MATNVTTLDTTESPIDAAFSKLEDSLATLEHTIARLSDAVGRAGTQLAPVLPDGTYTDRSSAISISGNILNTVHDNGGTPQPGAPVSAVRLRIDARTATVGRLEERLGDVAAILANILDAVEV